MHKGSEKRGLGRLLRAQLRLGIKFRCNISHQSLAQTSRRWLSQLWPVKNRQRKSRYLCEKMCLIVVNRKRRLQNTRDEQLRLAETNLCTHTSCGSHLTPQRSQADASSLCHWFWEPPPPWASLLFSSLMTWLNQAALSPTLPSSFRI